MDLHGTFVHQVLQSIQHFVIVEHEGTRNAFLRRYALEFDDVPEMIRVGGLILLPRVDSNEKHDGATVLTTRHPEYGFITQRYTL